MIVEMPEIPEDEDVQDTECANEEASRREQRPAPQRRDGEEVFQIALSLVLI